MKFSEVTSTSSVEKADMFANFFKSVFKPVEVNEEYISALPGYQVHLPMPNFTVEEIRDALQKVDASKGPGPDMIPPVFLKKCASSLAEPICFIFNRSLNERIFPEIWKTASITPIFKSGDHHRVENYRPISILSSLSKVFEKLVHDRLYAAAKPVISEFQHGFIKKRSTVTNLMCYVSALNNSLERGRQVDAVYVDFAKAFDRVPHNILIAKLNQMGFPSWCLQWIESYLKNRMAFTKIKSASSETFYALSGVPQGSHLGPLLFALFVNDICSIFASEKLLYADDLKLFREIRCIIDCLALQADICALQRWCNLNGMSANSEKCKVINFTKCQTTIRHEYIMNNVVLQNVPSILDLGVKIDSKLSFIEHIALTAAKGFAALGFLRRNAADFDDIYALKSVYCATVRSILEYAVQVWAPSHSVHQLRLERVQRSFLRFALRRLPWNDPVHLPSYTDRCMLIHLDPLDKRRRMLQQIFVFDMLTNRIDSSYILSRINLYVPSRNLRQRSFLWIPPHRTLFGQNHPIDKCCQVFNCVAFNFDFNMTKQHFKLAIRNSP